MCNTCSSSAVTKCFSQSIVGIKFFKEYHQCQTVWIHIRPDKMLGLIGVQTVCKGHQQMILAGKEFISIYRVHIRNKTFFGQVHCGHLLVPRQDFCLLFLHSCKYTIKRFKKYQNINFYQDLIKINLTLYLYRNKDTCSIWQCQVNPKSTIDNNFKICSCFKAAYSVTFDIFRNFLFSFLIICKSRMKLCFHNKSVHFS